MNINPAKKFEIRNPKFEIRNSQTEIRNGFSLVELLVAIAIIALLITIGVGVGQKVMTAGNVKVTEANMAIIINAIETYHDEFNSYPGDTPTLGATETRLCSEYFHLTNHPGMAMELWGYSDPSLTPPDSRSKIEALPNNAVSASTPVGSDATARRNFEFLDAFGNAMRYSANGGLGGTPVLFSAGPDGLFGSIRDSDGDWVKSGTTIWGAGTDPEREAAAEDDIRSDK